MLNFKEGVILFPPTYKLESNKNLFSSGKNARIPGWTDRILYATQVGCELDME